MVLVRHETMHSAARRPQRYEPSTGCYSIRATGLLKRTRKLNSRYTASRSALKQTPSGWDILVRAKRCRAEGFVVMFFRRIVPLSEAVCDAFCRCFIFDEFYSFP
jgi:hypothetical protein